MRITLNLFGKEYQLQLKPFGKESQLQLVQETALELTFQLGVKPKSAALKRRRLWFHINLVIAVLAIAFIYVLITANNPNIPSKTSFQYYIILVWMTFPIQMLSSKPLYKYFTVWTFKRTDQKILKTTTYLNRKDHTEIFTFSEIQSILVKQHHTSTEVDHVSTELDSASTEVYMVLKSGKQMTLSQSSYSDDTSQQNSDLKYHEEIAQKMRNYLGW